MKYLLYIIIIFFFCSCNKLDGKIETRDKNKVYLVNGSMTKTFKFTLKTTSITNDSLYSYKTKIIELAPGDEVFIGNKNEVSKIEYPYKNISVLQTHPIDTSGNIPLPKGYKKLSEFAAIFRESIKGRDTIINGEHLKYTYSTVTIKDTLHPYPINYYKHQYEVTGQVEVKLKAQDAKDRQQ